MKKFGVIALAAILALAFAAPAWSLESEFGGYWRTRAYTNQGFTGNDDDESKDFTWVDTRTRLYYTAIFHENLKFVNKFEFDAVWGSGDLGDFGADGNGVWEIKNSYADFNLGPVNFKIGIQGYNFGRGFIIDDDFSGAIVQFKGDNMDIPVAYAKIYEDGAGEDSDDRDADMYFVDPHFTVGSMMFNPFFAWIRSEDPDASGAFTKFGAGLDDLNVYFAGLNFEMNLDPASLWLIGIYQGGSVDFDAGGDMDISAWLAGAGASISMGFGDIHGEFFYATGDEDGAADGDWEQFTVPVGQSYYWAEIMGYGIFDEQVSNNSPADKIGNIMAANLGVSFKPMDKLKISIDAWYAALAEDIVTATGSEENYLGTEIDLKITYKLIEGLNLDVVGAYLLAGEATTLDVDSDTDPFEIGTRLSLKF